MDRTFQATSTITESDISNLQEVWQQLLVRTTSAARIENLRWRIGHLEMSNRSKSFDSALKGKKKEIRFELGEPTNYQSHSNQFNQFTPQLPQPTSSYPYQLQQQIPGFPHPAQDYNASSWGNLYNQIPSLPPPPPPPQQFQHIHAPQPYYPSQVVQAPGDFYDSNIPSFHSSYGAYQPIVGGYSRFRTPSPEPNLIGTLEELEKGLASFGNGVVVDGGPAAEWKGFDAEELLDAEVESQFNEPSQTQQNGNGNVGFEEHSNRQHILSSLSLRTAPTPLYSYPTFNTYTTEEDRALQLHSQQVALHQSRLRQEEDIRIQRDILERQRREERLWREGEGANWSYSDPSIVPVPSTSTLTPQPSSSTLQPEPAVLSNKRGRKPSVSKVLPSLPSSNTNYTTAAASNPPPGSRKNRNPHATQLPGNGTRKIIKKEAEAGHSGPICSHCEAITTPLWRRSPEDKLLCNACGLYLKLHSTPRPLKFKDQPVGQRGRTSTGAAALALASLTPPECFNCKATSTPMWRKMEKNLCCNACSLYFKLHGKPRPFSLLKKQKAKAAASASATPIGSVNSSTVRATIPLPPSTTKSKSKTKSNGNEKVQESENNSLESSPTWPTLPLPSSPPAIYPLPLPTSIPDLISNTNFEIRRPISPLFTLGSSRPPILRTGSSMSSVGTMEGNGVDSRVRLGESFERGSGGEF